MKLKLYDSTIFTFFLFLVISIFFGLGVLGVEIGETQESKHIIYSIEFNYFGMDASKMEKLITIPLEEKLISINGILEYKSDVQYSKSTTTLYFSKKESAKNIYLSIRNIVDNLYNELPSDVQKPRIYSTDSNSKSIISIAFMADEKKDSLREWIELNLKKKIEAVDGVSEVIITGGTQKEILVEFDPDKSVAALQNPSAFATIIQDGNSLFPGSKIKYENREDSISFNTKIKTIDEIKQLPVKISGGYTTLGYLADIEMKPKMEDEIVRLNGEDCVSIAVKSASDGNSIAISKKCRKILKEFNCTGVKYNVLYDTGAVQLKLIKNVLFSLLESFCCIVLILPLFYSKRRTTFLILVLLPVSIVWTIGLLKFTHFSVNQYTISGLCIALGLIVDPALVISEICEKSSSKEEFLMKFKGVVPSMISASLTSIIVLLPLLFLDNIVGGIKNIAIAIIYMILISMMLSIVFFPSFVYSDKEICGKRKINNQIEKHYIKFTYKMVSYSSMMKSVTTAIYYIFIILPFFIFICMGKNLTLTTNSNVIYCSIDYETDISNKYIDKDIGSLISMIKNNEYISFIRSESKKGSVELEVGYKEKYNRDDVLLFLGSLGAYVPEGYYYVPGIKQKFEKKHNSFEISCIGDDSLKCREYVKTAAKKISESNLGKVVLNFKKDESYYEFIPDRTALAKNGLSVQSVSGTVRWLMFGPVADKWIQGGKEYDIRVVGKNVKLMEIEKIGNLFIPVKNGSVNINSLGIINKATDISKIYRRNGRRAAYFTVETTGQSTDKARMEIENILKSIDLEKGYGYSFNYEVRQMSSNYSLLFRVLVLCAVAVYILMVFLTEDFIKALRIISIIPVSIVLPLFIKLVFNNSLELGDIVGVIILSGISINNAIYISESNFRNVMLKVRNKIKSIIITSLTTIISSLPLLVFSNDSFSGSIAFFMVYGIMDSFMTSIFLYPVLEERRQMFDRAGKGI